MHSNLQASTVPLGTLDSEAVSYLLPQIGLADFRDAFVAADITGDALEALETNEELKELGITMPLLKFKAFLKRIVEVINLLVLYILSSFMLRFHSCA